ncbi:hypothetical protein B0H63DRAFT_46699 [Podospora didyma]|uniref:Protein kinase domain-containing protein n=1 Tax=Podospora didyma TaxID=330526 RepID=A0AAE0P6W6_9PEZI|nr:hypothetical protein B0H63DRAFT_46699 [Podospora didyma]
MELNSRSVHDVIHPTAAFSQTPPQAVLDSPDVGLTDPWPDSQLNPKNRIDSLDPPQNPLWRVDGCTGLGTQFYALPLFLGEVPPMRFDVFIPEEAAGSPVLRQLLNLNAAFHTKDSARLRRLGICSHILRTLQAWTERGQGDPQSVSVMHGSLPFGSRIIFENLDLNIRNIKITVAPTYYVENQLLAHQRLHISLGLNPEFLPEPIDISRLSIIQQLHDSVCLVHISHDGSHAEDGDGSPGKKIWILKALTSGTKYLYTELRNLMQIEPHAHIISRPKYLVTKYCRFGGKTGVVGFILPYHPAGSLRDILPLLQIHNRLTLEMQLNWATQLASALVHIRERGRIFYPDLRLENMVLSDTGDVVMVDFEQRGVWCEFAAPEVNALEYIRILASDDSVDQDMAPTIPEEVRERFAAILTRQLPDWEALQAREDYTPLPHGYNSYNVSWLCLSAVEQEAAEVYMLGRILWCVFEGQSAPQHAAVWQSYRWEPDIEFPKFHRTPPLLRDLVNRCTQGRREPLSNFIIRHDSRLVLRADVPGQDSSAAQVLNVAREWWMAEVKAAEDFLQMREEMSARGEWSGNYYDRPTMREVLAELRQCSASSIAGSTT